MARLVICTQTLQILACNRRVGTLLGYHPHEINGQNILKLTGPRSDPKMLRSAIQEMHGHKMQLILYDVSGCERRLIISCSPFNDACAFIGCLLSIRPSDAVMLHDAFEDCGQARVVVSLDAPYTIRMANEAFLDQFCRCRSTVIGLPVNLFFGDQ